jgi:hypothetical protein
MITTDDTLHIDEAITPDDTLPQKIPSLKRYTLPPDDTFLPDNILAGGQPPPDDTPKGYPPSK